MLMESAADSSKFLVFRNVESTECINLYGAEVSTMGAGNYVGLKINDGQRNAIARWDGLRGGPADPKPFLRVLSSAITDDYGNFSLGFSTAVFDSMLEWLPDETPPQLTGATYTVTAGDINLWLSFSEYIDVLSVDLYQFSLQDTSDGSSHSSVLHSSCAILTQETDSKNLRIEIPYGYHETVWAWGTANLYLSVSETALNDLSGNTLVEISSSSAFHIFTDTSSSKVPEVTWHCPPNGGYNISRSTGILVKFSEYLKPDDVIVSIEVSQTADSVGNETNYEIDFETVTFNKRQRELFFKPESDLPGNSVIKVFIRKEFVKNLFGDIMENDYSWTFKTSLVKSSANLLVSPSGAVSVYIPAGQMPSDGSVDFTEGIPPNTPKAASAAKILQANAAEETWRNPYHYPLDELTTELVFNSKSGAIAYWALSEKGSLTLNYSSCLSETEGYAVSGSGPPVKETTLRIYYLEETGGRWIPVNSEVDEENNTLTAPLNHFSVYTVMGSESYEVEDAHPYPVPYKPYAEAADGGIPKEFAETLRAGITFTGLPSECDINIYTVTGRLVNTFHHSDADLQLNGQIGNYYWFPVENSEGAEVASGVYIYHLKSGNNQKTGKIMIIR